jgi:arsenite methyltransferase
MNLEKSQQYHGTLDKGLVIEVGRVFPVCGNSRTMLAETRFAPHFDFIGDCTRHFAVFEGCGGGLPFDVTQGAQAATCC